MYSNLLIQYIKLKAFLTQVLFSHFQDLLPAIPTGKLSIFNICCLCSFANILSHIIDYGVCRVLSEREYEQQGDFSLNSSSSLFLGKSAYFSKLGEISLILKISILNCTILELRQMEEFMLSYILIKITPFSNLDSVNSKNSSENTCQYTKLCIAHSVNTLSTPVNQLVENMLIENDCCYITIMQGLK